MSDVCISSVRFRRALSKNSFFIFLLVSANFACLSSAYAQEGQSAKAEIVIETVSDSSATRGKNIVVTYYQDEQCKRRGKTEKVFKKNYVEDLHSFNPLAVETDSPFIFQVSYIEKRRGETRSCAAISNVSLEPNRSYKAIFKIVDQVVGCNISVFDVTDIIQAPVLVDNGDVDQNSGISFLQIPVMDKKPENTCARVGKPGYKNGTPVYSYKDRLG